ncbi:MAG: hypothetical protein OEY64_05900 [Nitrospinota bacterium]|nr:hypothetical protein [Nitrospinota bacterium]
MWEDVKKIGGLLLGQTKEQKDIVLLKLREVSFKNKKEDAFTRLGQNAFNLLAASQPVNAENDQIKMIIEEINGIDSEIEKINELLESLKIQAASERDVMATEVSSVWEKTKSALSKEDEPVSKPSAARKEAPKKEEKSKERDEDDIEPPKGETKSEPKGGKGDSGTGKKKG